MKKNIKVVLIVGVIILIVVSLLGINRKLFMNFKNIAKETKDDNLIENVEKVATVYSVSVGNEETVPVPKGFYYVGGSIKSGVIISDNEADKYDGQTDKTTHEYATKLKGNQFVWIPCTIDEYTKIDFGMTSASSWDRETNTSEKEQI